MRLKGKVALVTGAASGIGLAIAVKFAQEQARVLLADIDSYNGGRAVQLIKEQGGVVEFFRGNVSIDADAKAMVERAADLFGKLDILCNSAGVRLTGSILELTEEQWDRTIDTDLKGVFLVSRHAVPIMIGCGGGSIINIASVSGFVGGPRRVAYCAAKGGVVIMTQAMAADLAVNRIRVNSICPATVRTPMLGELTPEQEKAKARSIPLGRLGTPEDVASAALYLASDESSFVTGSTIVVDGGATLRQ